MGGIPPPLFDLLLPSFISFFFFSLPLPTTLASLQQWTRLSISLLATPSPSAEADAGSGTIQTLCSCIRRNDVLLLSPAMETSRSESLLWGTTFALSSMVMSGISLRR